jgi:hypothetical protein
MLTALPLPCVPERTRHPTDQQSRARTPRRKSAGFAGSTPATDLPFSRGHNGASPAVWLTLVLVSMRLAHNPGLNRKLTKPLRRNAPAPPHGLLLPSTHARRCAWAWPLRRGWLLRGSERRVEDGTHAGPVAVAGTQPPRPHAVAAPSRAPQRVVRLQVAATEPFLQGDPRAGRVFRAQVRFRPRQVPWAAPPARPQRRDGQHAVQRIHWPRRFRVHG